MATYLVDEEFEIIRQEGDTADIEFTVPDELDMQNYDVHFSVRKNLKTPIFDKLSKEGDCTITGQVIYIPIDAEDTKGYNGTFMWELELSNTEEVITIGRGDFTIIRELIV